MSFEIKLALLTLLFIAAIIIVKRIKNSHKIEHDVIKDPKAQADYDNQKHHEEENKVLSMEDKIELSWEFLIRITEKIMKSFSKSDVKIVHNAGKSFNNHGMKYEHDVNHEIRVINAQERRKSVSKKQTKSASRSR